MRCRCEHDISKCHPIGGHSTPGDLFGEYVYCSHDRKPCHASPYIEWGNYVASFCCDNPEAKGCLDYEKWLRKKYGEDFSVESEAK